MGYEQVSVITNCVRTGRQEGYLKCMVETGLNDILMSLHGVAAETHDGLTGVKGSQQCVLQTASMASEVSGPRSRFNCVVCQENCDDCEAAADLMA